MTRSITRLLLPALAAVGSAFGQCSMCYQAAASQTPQAMHALNVGIVILLVPPAAVAACIARVAYRCRDAALTPPKAGARSRE